MEIVRLQKEHCEILAELEKLCFSHPWSQRAIEDEVHNSNAYFVTAVDGDKILGYGGMHCTHQECYVDNIAVFGHHRKKGVGTAIVLALVHEAQRRGAEYISLEVRPSNRPAVGLYTKLGFLEEGRRRNFYNDPTEDALILTPAFPKGGQGMIVLGIESSCDETAAALVEDGRKILSSVVASQVEEHKIYGGVVPEIASRRHSEAIVAVVQEALERGRKKLSQVDAIAVTYAPGLIGALLVGVNFAKGLSLATGLPLVPVHHLRGHIASGYLSDARLEPPFLCLVASGGHSHIVQVEDYTKLKILGRTRDDAAGGGF